MQDRLSCLPLSFLRCASLTPRFQRTYADYLKITHSVSEERISSPRFDYTPVLCRLQGTAKIYSCIILIVNERYFSLTKNDFSTFKIRRHLRTVFDLAGEDRAT
jgi:hypothetical protein